MQIKHHIAFNAQDPIWRDFERLGVRFDTGSSVIWVLDLTEDDPSWPAVERILASHGRESGQYVSVYSKREQDDAEWLSVGASGHHGYPQPEDEYFELTYDPTSCRRCGIHGEQVRPFRLRSEPKAQHSQFLQLNAVFDVLFARADAQRDIAAAGLTGIDFTPALINKSREPSREVSQMRLNVVLPAALDASRLQTVTCMPGNGSPGLPYCRRVKYHLRTRGPFHFARSALAGAPDLGKSQEWFGSGGQAFRLIICSQAFRQLVIANKWRGLFFNPLVLVD